MIVTATKIGDFGNKSYLWSVNSDNYGEKIHIKPQTGLVLEGGGMRGVFTCGVLDSFMDRGIRFPYTIGVSAGACNGLSYMSGQRGRAKYSNIDLLEKYQYIGLKYLLKKRNIMDFDLLFRSFPSIFCLMTTSPISVLRNVMKWSLRTV